jgi:hypothetical protein
MSVCELLANSQKLWEPEFVDFLQSGFELLPIVIILWKGQDIFAPFFGQLGRQDQEIGSDSIQCGVEILSGKTQPFEPMDDIVSQQEHLKKGHIGHPVFRGDLAQGIIVEEFPDIFLDGGSLGVELPDPPGMGLQVGHQDMVGIFSIFEEGQLLGLYRVFRNGASDHDKTMRSFPPKRLVSEFSDFPALRKFFETTPPSLRFDSGIFPGHNHIAASERIEKLDDSSAKESRIGSDTDAGTGNRFGDLGQTAFEKWYRSSTGGCVSRSQAAMPELLEMGLETQQRMIGTSASLLGIVTYFCKLGLPIDREDYRVQIEDQCGSGFGYRKQFGAKLVVQGNELADGLGRKPLEKTTQCGLIGKLRESQHGEKNPIVLQDLGLVDPSQASHDSVEESQDQIRGEIVGIALRNPDVFLDQPAKSEFVAKTLCNKKGRR